MNCSNDKPKASAKIAIVAMFVVTLPLSILLNNYKTKPSIQSEI